MRELTEEQKIFLNTSGNIVLHACPGSGKTFVVAQKLLQYMQNWSRPHQGIAVLSFTNVASEEIEKQTKELVTGGFEIDYPHYVGTLDSFINNYILLRFGYLLFTTAKRPKIAIKDYFLLPFAFWRTECHRKGCVAGIHEFHWNIDGQLFRGKEPVECDTGRYGTPCSQYKKMLFKKEIVFQGEVASFSYMLLKKYPQVAQAVATRFPVIILDEAQDTSIEQMEVLDLLNQAGMESMFLVGDPDQSIYEWRDATPECFTNKMNCKDWKTLSLTTNFRSSQLICNATRLFAKSLENMQASISNGLHANHVQKPILLLYSAGNNNSKEQIINKFLTLCSDNDVEVTPNNVAVVTRGSVNSDTDIKELWKSHEVEFFAQASYEWSFGSRKKAYECCEKALFSLFIKDHHEINISIKSDIEEIMSYETWRANVIEFLISLPNPNLPLGKWIEQAKANIAQCISSLELKLCNSAKINDIIKIKSRDTKIPNFKEIPLKQFFEKRSSTNYTRSSVHGVKGETYDAILLHIKSNSKKLTPKILNKKDLNTEELRVAYVAMTRPRKLLVVAMPKTKNKTENLRFPPEYWEYINV